MITCQHARHMIDRHLDDELSPSMQAEFHAHVVSCTSCQSELALFEACGDVIRLDRGEPRPSASFTDRVLLARRSQRVIRPRQWRRNLTLIATPMAAAASIALAVMLILPTVPQQPKTEIATKMVAAPEKVQQALKEVLGTEERSPLAEQELAETPQMTAAGFVDALLKPVVEEAQTTLNGARRSAVEFEMLLRAGLSNPSERLVEGWRSQNPKQENGPARPDTAGPAPEPWDPTRLNRPSVAEPQARESLEAL